MCAKWQQQQHLLLIALACSLHAATVAALPFRLYEPCPEDAGGVGLCRTEPSSKQQDRCGSVLPAAVTKPVPKQLAVDMRFPCTEPQSCKLNVDVVRQPDPPTGDDISSCSVSLMPWSAFPCAFDAAKYSGVPDQPSDLCYTDRNTLSQEPRAASLATNLTTDGYNNLFYGVLPQQLCDGVEVPHIEALLLTIEFRLASGRQFDRTYSFQIGHAVAAFGTCSEPSRLINADKTWSTRVDITHLQPYLQAGMPTRFSLANVLSNTYNVPIWARARLDVYHKHAQPSASAKTHRQQRQQQHQQQLLPQQSPSQQEDPHHAVGRALHGMAVVQAASASALPLSLCDTPAVPDEVMPLVPPGQAGMEALSVFGGQGDSPIHWPNATFELPPSLSEAGNIYRAQLRVVPKGNGCEEFWAMNPSGASTNSTCGGFSTGEPFREVRVYVDGQLAGFYPISYTMYTGGVDPRLWTAIVAVNTYSLPVYTYDLSPWLGVLNAYSASDGIKHTITVEVSGASGNDWVLANTLLLWRDRSGNVVSGPRPVVAASPSMSERVVSTCEGEDIANVGACVLQLGQRTVVAGSLLKVGDADFAAFVKYQLHSYTNAMSYNNIMGSATWRQLTSHEASWFLGHLEYPLRPPEADVLDAVSGAALLLTSKQKSAMHGSKHAHGHPIVTRAHTRYEWLNAGGISDGAVFEFSDNTTVVEPHTYNTLASSSSEVSMLEAKLGGQQHYQRLLMLDVYNTSKPACVVPSYATHTVSLNTTIGRSAQPARCVQWYAACAFCSPELIVNKHDVHTNTFGCHTKRSMGGIKSTV